MAKTSMQETFDSFNGSEEELVRLFKLLDEDGKKFTLRSARSCYKSQERINALMATGLDIKAAHKIFMKEMVQEADRLLAVHDAAAN